MFVPCIQPHYSVTVKLTVLSQKYNYFIWKVTKVGDHRNFSSAIHFGILQKRLPLLNCQFRSSFYIKQHLNTAKTLLIKAGVLDTSEIHLNIRPKDFSRKKLHDLAR